MKFIAILLIGILLVGIYTHTETKSFKSSNTNYKSQPRITYFNTQDQDLKPVTKAYLKNSLTTLNLKDTNFILLSFWATWCPTCKPELTTLNTLQKSWAHKNINIISINVDPSENSSKVDKIWLDLNLDLKFIRNFNPDILNDLKVEVLPSYLLVNDNLELILRIDGATNWTNEKTQKLITDKLSKKNKQIK